MELAQNKSPTSPNWPATTALIIFAASLPFSVSFVQGAILLLVISGTLHHTRNRTASIIFDSLKNFPLFTPFIIYLLSGSLAAAFGISPTNSLKSLNSDLLTAISVFSLYLFLPKDNREKVLNIYLVAVFAAAIIGISQSLYAAYMAEDLRAHATSHPVRFGEIMVIGLSLAVSRIAFTSAHRKATYWLYLVVITITTAITLSQTRSSYLGAIAVYLLALAFNRSQRKVIVILGICAIFVGLLLSIVNPIIRYKAVSIFYGAKSTTSAQRLTNDGSINIRLDLWNTGLRMIKDRPLLGSGPGNTKAIFKTYFPDGNLPGDKVWGSLHNLYIHQAAERGLIGFAALALLLGTSFLMAFRNYYSAPSEYTLWALMIMPPWLLMNVTEISFHHVHTAYAVNLALAISHISRKP